MDSLKSSAKTGSPKTNDPQKQPKLKKKKVVKTVSFVGTKKKRNFSPPPSALDGLLQNFDGIFRRRIFPYERRTVNSVVELPDDTEEVTDSEEELPRRKKRKPGLIDSEVDLMMTLPKRPAISFPNPSPHHDLSIIQEIVPDDTVKNTTEAKRKKKSNVSSSQVSQQISAAASSTKKQSYKESAPKDEDATEKYPVLKDKELVKKFMSVQMTNNQKGRIRQVIREILRGTSPTLLPEVLNNKIQTILRSSQNLTDTDLRKIRILFNMLLNETRMIDKQLSAISVDSAAKIDPPSDEMKEKKKKKHEVKENKPKEKEKQKVKGMKRYVVFVGNMPVNVTREEIMNHFNDIRDYVKDIRIPQPADDRKSAYAYVELTTGTTYEMALSKHHSMMGSKRINVLYTTQQKSKVTKAEAKAKSAKLIAMQKEGQLVGSIPLKKKRSQRRAKQRQAQKAAEKALEKKAITWRD